MQLSVASFRLSGLGGALSWKVALNDDFKRSVRPVIYRPLILKKLSVKVSNSQGWESLCVFSSPIRIEGEREGGESMSKRYLGN